MGSASTRTKPKQGTQGIALYLEKEKRKETKEDLERKSKKNIGYEYVKGAVSGGWLTRGLRKEPEDHRTMDRVDGLSVRYGGRRPVARTASFTHVTYL